MTPRQPFDASGLRDLDPPEAEPDDDGGWNEQRWDEERERGDE